MDASVAEKYDLGPYFKTRTSAPRKTTSTPHATMERVKAGRAKLCWNDGKLFSRAFVYLEVGIHLEPN